MKEQESKASLLIKKNNPDYKFLIEQGIALGRTKTLEKVKKELVLIISHLEKCNEQGLDKSEWTESEMFSLNEIKELLSSLDKVEVKE